MVALERVLHRARRSVTERVRFAGGALCVVVAGVVFVTHVPPVFREFNEYARHNSWRNAAEQRVEPGNQLGVPQDFQEAALATVPRNSTFAVIPPLSATVAQDAYGINGITLIGVNDYLLYLLLPARRVEPGDAQYVLCFGCDTAPWDHRTRWLWQNSRGEAIGEVKGR